MFKVPISICVICGYYFRAGRAHLLNRALAVTWLDIDWAHGVLQSLYFESVFDRVEHGVLHTIIRGESADNNFFNTLLVKLRGEISFIKRRVTICIAEAF